MWIWQEIIVMMYPKSCKVLGYVVHWLFKSWNVAAKLTYGNLTKNIYGCVRLCMTVHDCVWLCRAGTAVHSPIWGNRPYYSVAITLHIWRVNTRWNTFLENLAIVISNVPRTFWGWRVVPGTLCPEIARPQLHFNIPYPKQRDLRPAAVGGGGFILSPSP